MKRPPACGTSNVAWTLSLVSVVGRIHEWPPEGLRGRKAARRLRAAVLFPPFLLARCKRKGAPLEADSESRYLYR